MIQRAKLILKNLTIITFFVDIYRHIKNRVTFFWFAATWKKANPHNKTKVRRVFPKDKVKVGKGSYGLLDVYSWRNNKEMLLIGDCVSVSDDVKFILGGNHRIDTFTTFPFSSIKHFNPNLDATTKGPIIVEDGVWIGTSSIIMSGLTIGRESIVAAGSVVTKSFPPYSIIGGNPARLIRHRLVPAQIEIAELINYSSILEHGLDATELLALYSSPKAEASKELSKFNSNSYINANDIDPNYN
ncbi:CatB-related O-acetyltransferase [Vibrio maritimus]|uniref:CatB-related O-acetyltransferase n=1 Tax=Vibrio maritimus TaxID=990268 RepID=UPI003734E085